MKEQAIALQTNDLDNRELRVLIESIIVMKGWKCNISPFDIDNRKTNGSWFLALTTKKETAKIELLKGYEVTDDEYQVTIESHYIDFLNRIEQLKYYK